MNWTLEKLGALAELTVGHVGTMANQYESEGVPFLRSLNVKPHRIDPTDLKFINPEFARSLKKSRLRTGDVVTVRTGAPGQTSVIPHWLDGANCSDLVIIRPREKLHPKWLSYHLNWITKAKISQHLVGAVQQHFNVSSAASLSIQVPPISYQRAVAEVLGALDDKIAANENLISSMQSTMKAIAGTSSAIVRVGDISKRGSKSVNPQTVDGEVEHFSLPAFDSGEAPENVGASSIKSNKFAIETSCVLVSKLNPRIPRIWNVPIQSDGVALASTEFVVLVPQGLTTSALWAALNTQTFFEEMRGKVAGTSGSHQRVKPQDILDAMIPDPRALEPSSCELIDYLGLLGARVKAMNFQLARTRDELLPLLMSGKITVKDAEAVVSDAV